VFRLPNAWRPVRTAAFLTALLAIFSVTRATAQGIATPIPVSSPIAGVPSPGAAGIGDPYYPLLGNGGYDALHYTLDLDLDIAEGSIRTATAAIDAVATQDLSSFNFDYRGPQIDAITVDGAAATWTRNAGELTITPARPIANGAAFQTQVRYHGKPDVDLNDRFERGWWATGDSIFTVGEPSGSDVWYPVNGHPRDKATYTLNITVPEPYEVVANGQQTAVAFASGAAGNPSTMTYTWENREPTASYLVTFHAADLNVTKTKGPDGITLIDAFPANLPESDSRLFEYVPDIVRLFTRLFGPYPYPSLGNTVFADTNFDAAMETQTMIGYDESAVSERTIAHEIAHQWFGDSVTPARWQDIWLNEGFARYAEILWAESAHGEEARDAALHRQMALLATVSRTPDGHGVLIGDPGPDHLFTEAVYAGGALLLDDLRHRIGDDNFFRLLHEWAARHRFGNVTTPDFVALAEEISGQNLDAFFVAWLETPWTPDRVADRYPIAGTPVP
jgi:aminopeptidase N